MLLEFPFSYSGHHHDLHSFPTRRSSDLQRPLPLPSSPDDGGPPRVGGAGPAPAGFCRPRATDRSGDGAGSGVEDRKSTRLNSSHVAISYAVFCLKKKNESKRIAARQTIA